MSNLTPLLHEHYDAIATALADSGFIIFDEIFPAAMTQALAALIVAKKTQLKRAGIGRAEAFQLDASVRGDAIEWLEPGDAAVTAFLFAMDELGKALNQRLFLGLSEYEAHFASYEPGAFYAKHRDAFRGKPTRKVSSVFYLNPAWDVADGGELVLYDESETTELCRVAPECGRLVLFLSEDFPHEVLPATRERHSIAGWFRVKSDTLIKY